MARPQDDPASCSVEEMGTVASELALGIPKIKSSL